MSTNHVLNGVRPEAAPARLAQVIDAIARTRHIMIACGDTLTREASITGIEDPVDVYYGRETRRSSLQTLLRECSPLQTSPDTLDQRLLASLNAAMAKRRIAARNCEAGPFLQFLSNLRTQGRLTAYLTTSFDGVEAVLNPDVDDRVFRLHGDNRTVRCCRTLCVAQSDEASAVYDDPRRERTLKKCRLTAGGAARAVGDYFDGRRKEAVVGQEAVPEFCRTPPPAAGLLRFLAILALALALACQLPEPVPEFRQVQELAGIPGLLQLAIVKTHHILMFNCLLDAHEE
ncbi:SIR2 family transcriptional regulator [Ceratobasidium sp. AG-Ba]|nr:SIR2 family transcriptional regulator [Ceratobasidium sp. AG-Ba]